MSKYILSPDGSVIKEGTPVPKEKIIEKVSKPKVAQGGSNYTKESNVGAFSNTNLPFFSSGITSVKDGLQDHIINTEVVSTGDDNFVSGSRDDKFLANPSFGGDENIQYYKNFNNYLGVNEIFASELEMIAGLELSTFGFKDTTKLVFWLDYVVEASIYIAAIEGILAAEDLVTNAANLKGTTNIEQDFQMEMGNYGPVNYTSLTRYIHEHLRYPKDKSTKSGIGGVGERLGSFYVGLSFYVNTDPLIFLEKFSKNSSGKYGKLGVAEQPIPFIDKTFSLLTNDNAGRELLFNLGFYLVESILSLSSIGSNRLLMLVRRFNQKSDWVVNKLYKAKSNATFASGDNSVEKFLVELNYYYVTFIVERMHVGLKVKKYYKNKKSARYKLNRSGRAKDSITGFSKVNVNYSNPESETVEIKKISGDKRLEKKQSMSISALPQAFIMPESMLKSSAYNNLGSHFLEEHVKNYFIKTKKAQQRISNETVKAFEAFYEKEMVPFYFQDLRTNEILGFHAFIDNYSDSFSPQYNETSPGYGRVDKVYHYISTARQIQISFTLASMSKEDHDLMWYQINKLVSMVYPQWSRGFKNKALDKDGKLGFEYPFTQVPTASPLIRMRFGDVFKSNYTKHAISKIHGMGQGKEDIDFIPKAKKQVKDFLASFGAKPDTSGLTLGLDLENKKEEKYYILPGDYTAVDTATNDTLTVSVREFQEVTIKKRQESVFQVSLADLTMPFYYEVDSKSIVTYYDYENSVDKSDAQFTDSSANKKQFNNYIDSFDDDGRVNNPITAAYETTLGKGLAGFIGNLSINANEQLWETEVVGSKAPMSVKIDMSFSPIHDIAPGLDADGMMRAPVYNTGKIINSLYGDVYDEDE